MSKTQASGIGLVLGAVFTIMGFAYDNSGIWILGLIFLSIGLWMRLKRRDN